MNERSEKPIYGVTVATYQGVVTHGVRLLSAKCSDVGVFDSGADAHFVKVSFEEIQAKLIEESMHAGEGWRHKVTFGRVREDHMSAMGELFAAIAGNVPYRRKRDGVVGFLMEVRGDRVVFMPPVGCECEYSVKTFLEGFERAK